MSGKEEKKSDDWETLRLRITSEPGRGSSRFQGGEGAYSQGQQQIGSVLVNKTRLAWPPGMLWQGDRLARGSERLNFVPWRTSPCLHRTPR